MNNNTRPIDYPLRKFNGNSYLFGYVSAELWKSIEDSKANAFAKWFSALYQITYLNMSARWVKVMHWMLAFGNGCDVFFIIDTEILRLFFTLGVSVSVKGINIYNSIKFCIAMVLYEILQFTASTTIWNSYLTVLSSVLLYFSLNQLSLD